MLQLAPLLALQVAPAASVAPAAARPNFLFILMDDWGIGDVGAYQVGHRLTPTSSAKTPAIDRFAREEAVMFTRGFSAHPVCSPSRTAWMTGRFPRFPAEVGIHSALPCSGCKGADGGGGISSARVRGRRSCRGRKQRESATP